MGFLKNLIGSKKDGESAGGAVDQGLLIFDSVNDVIQAEATLKKAAFDDIKVVAPPPQYRMGCDLAIQFSIMERIGIVRVLEESRNEPRDIIYVSEELMQPTEICSVKDFGRYLMVRSANMKITVEKDTGKIVNISGGGCSDVPYLAVELIGKTLDAAASPRKIGYTLCAYTLEIAFNEARRMLA
ncbi:MAG: DUF3343 domain-containing protein [Deltaproteobacteria bacterium]|nr:DUF3343 domain-containing protein [Deltaproteobacteria bacterium]